MTQCATNNDVGPTYLIVDDHAGFRRALRSHLPGKSFKVVECASGREAVDAFERHGPDWTLMDLEMPGMDGLSATREIRRRFPEARIVIVTQHDLPEFRQAALAEGVAAFLPKDDLIELAVILSQRVAPPPIPSNPNIALTP